MTQGMMVSTECPKGHLSTEADYCSECGAKIAGAPGKDTGVDLTPAGELCPDCGTLRERHIVFCEVCGFNFETGSHGELGAIPPARLSEEEAAASTKDEATRPASASEVEAPATPAAKAAWRVILAADPALRRDESPEIPLNLPSTAVELTGASHLIGRVDEGRGIHPEVAIPWDDAVSRRHALLEISPAGELSVRDIGAANGTRLNGQVLEAMKDYPLHPGDRITLGHWTSIVVAAS